MFFRADNYVVITDISVIKYDTKEIEKRAVEMKFVDHTVDFSTT